MRTPVTGLILAAVCLSAIDPVWAESISVQDRDEIARLRSVRGFAAEEIGPLLEQVNKAGERGLPVEPLANKVKEGLAKGVEPKRIDPVLRQMVTHFESAQEALREASTRGVTEGNRRAAVETLADAFSRGATADDVRELMRLSQDGKQKVTQESLAAGAKSLAVMREGKISSKEGAALVGEGIRQGYKPSELLDLSREVKRRGGEVREGRATMQSLQERVRRGERGERLFRNEHGDSGGGDRGDRGGTADHGERVREDRGSGGGDRGGGSDRGGRPERGGGGHGGRDH
ncbi:MAG: hypothetical protein GDA68_10830 [Nitrospira sp. CR2.1]|nr:hypothetical protein [Nitrospira sp. CR2.1]